MLTMRGIYDGEDVKLQEHIKVEKPVGVIVTLIDNETGTFKQVEEDRKRLWEEYEKYYQELTPEEKQEELFLLKEFDIATFETDELLEE